MYVGSSTSAVLKHPMDNRVHSTAVHALLFILIVVTTASSGARLLSDSDDDPETRHMRHRKREPYRLPAGVVVRALVFYGRRSTVKLLNCYLEINLVKNGGLLSEVIFAVKTTDAADARYLDTLISR